MDYEEFCDTVRFQYELLHKIYLSDKPIGQATNHKLMRDLHIYMAVEVMFQEVEAYLKKEIYDD